MALTAAHRLHAASGEEEPETAGEPGYERRREGTGAATKTAAGLRRTAYATGTAPSASTKLYEASTQATVVNSNVELTQGVG